MIIGPVLLTWNPESFLDKDQRMTLTPDTCIYPYTHLDNYIYQLLYHRLQ